MSIRIIKAGILDSLQDHGRYGYQHLGINPGGFMDRFSAGIINFLIGNPHNEVVIEMHFPSSTILFQQQSMIAIGGGDFSATINGEAIPLFQPVIVNKNSLLQFQRQKNGARTYIAFKEGLVAVKWLNSYSTNLKAMAGGFHGRGLQKDDVIPFIYENDYSHYLQQKDFHVLPWKADINWNDPSQNEIFVLHGNEWQWLDKESHDIFQHSPYTISNVSDRMGYRLTGILLHSIQQVELVSSAVNFGTIQLLPGGELIILMADHQTTGGYPRVAHVIKAHLSKLAQKKAGDELNFRITDQKTAEQLLLKQYQHLQNLQNACQLRLSSFFGKLQVGH